ncbi:hypothetical protein CWD08_20620 [Salmonella enterica]|nr:hypothetical protein [Salmonella enterica]
MQQIKHLQDAESTPEAITLKIKEWRAANGKPGFKQG